MHPPISKDHDVVVYVRVLTSSEDRTSWSLTHSSVQFIRVNVVEVFNVEVVFLVFTKV